MARGRTVGVSRNSGESLGTMTRQEAFGPAVVADLRDAFMMAAAFSFVAAIPLGAAGILSVLGALLGYDPMLSLREWLAVLGVIMGGYALAATTAGLVYAVSRPFRRTLVGSMVVGAVMTPLIYGSLGFMAWLFWEPAGRLIFGDAGTTRATFWDSLPFMVVVTGAIGLAAGPFCRRAWRDVATVREERLP